MGCATSKKDEEEDNDVVLLCKERKRLLKMAVESRSELAEAQCKYNNSLYAVAAAIRLFVSRYSSPSSPLLITFPSTTTNATSSETFVSKSMFLQQTPSQPTYKTIPCLSESSKVDREEKEQGSPEEEGDDDGDGTESTDTDDDEESGSQESLVCDHFYGETAPPMPEPQRAFQWDFFNPFDGVRTEEMANGFGQNLDEDLRAVREQEGIPDLEEVGEKVTSVGKTVDVNNGVVCNNEAAGGDGNGGGCEAVAKGEECLVSQEEQKCLRVIDTPNDGRDLLEALKDVVDLFIRAYDSGLDVSRMLETNMVQVQSALEEIKENSNKLIRSITRSRSTSSTLSWSPSCKSMLTSSSKSSSTWTEFKSEMFDEYGGMEAGSHSLTLGRLYAWEKKLYQEVKSSEEMRKSYEQKCSQLRNQIAKGDDGLRHDDKTAAEVDSLYSQICVAVSRAESISETIHKLRDQELQPQLVELLQGLTRNWKTMQEMHDTQNRIMYEVKSFHCPSYGKFSNDSHRLATLQLDAELQNWHTCFATYVSSQKAYVEALNGWLSKFITPETQLYSNGRPLLSISRINVPPLIVMCHDWLDYLNKLPDKGVTYAMKGFRKDVQALLVKQGEEQQRKRKVEGLAKELDRKVLAFQKAEKRVLESKLSEQEAEMHVRSRIEYLTEKKEQLDMFQKRIDTEKVKHQTNMHETQRTAVNGFQTGFSSLFESLAEFSQAAVKMYVELVTFSESSMAKENGSNASLKE
ncbi:protein ALTERED PHOSPHATE STARVATION RESPONSE 1-like [Humulus lupulus]|uniref:protein ALTERED PHOSPHATE STARVATION RESPONSE 1-like n=1 Tax=Humulus lupulus TaxID=3486 RepID=UPI002B405B0A|nr:protein ALTERED PHOSPHATE STARVATION RESPONSE 1-like [Humulus lupulus]